MYMKDSTPFHPFLHKHIFSLKFNTISFIPVRFHICVLSIYCVPVGVV